jgi:hypothetical protein
MGMEMEMEGREMETGMVKETETEMRTRMAMARTRIRTRTGTTRTRTKTAKETAELATRRRDPQNSSPTYSSDPTTHLADKKRRKCKPMRGYGLCLRAKRCVH